MSVNDSAKLVFAYRTQGVIDADRMILEDPRESNDWRQVTSLGCLSNPVMLMIPIVIGQVAISTLPDTFPILDSLKPDNSPVNELMNLAWAQHEIVPYHLDEVSAAVIYLSYNT